MNQHGDHRKRLRDKYIKNGIGVFAEHEVLELLLTYAIPRVDTNKTAHVLLDAFGSLRGVIEADVRDLALISGVGENTAVFLAMLRDVERLLMLSPRKKRAALNSPKATGEYLRALLSGKRLEEFYVICLDGRMRLIHTERLSVGNVNEVVAYPRFVVDTARRQASHGVIVAHNHPSGSLRPSEADIGIGMKISDALSACGIVYLDHMIVTNDGYYSMKTDQSYPFPDFSDDILPAPAAAERRQGSASDEEQG